MEKDGGYVFELFQYTHQVATPCCTGSAIYVYSCFDIPQVKYMCGDKVKSLKPVKALDRLQFRRKLDNPQMALKLITLSPLFTALNDEPKRK